MTKWIGIPVCAMRFVQYARILGIAVLVGSFSACRVEYQDNNLQRFGPGEAAALDGKQLYFTYTRASFDSAMEGDGGKLAPQWGYPPYYYRAVSEQTDFLVDPTNHETIDFSASDPFLLPGSDDAESDFPSNFVGVYVGSDGTIAFTEPGTGNATLTDFFSTTQVSLLPLDATAEGSRVSYGIQSEMLVVTYENVEGTSVQFIMATYETTEQRFPGTGDLNYDDIVITYREVSETVQAGVVGISWLSLKYMEPAYVSEFLAGFEEGAGGQANLTESTDTTTGGRVILPLP